MHKVAFYPGQPSLWWSCHLTFPFVQFGCWMCYTIWRNAHILFVTFSDAYWDFLSKITERPHNVAKLKKATFPFKARSHYKQNQSLPEISTSVKSHQYESASQGGTKSPCKPCWNCPCSLTSLQAKILPMRPGYELEIYRMDKKPSRSKLLFSKLLALDLGTF